MTSGNQKRRRLGLLVLWSIGTGSCSLLFSPTEISGDGDDALSDARTSDGSNRRDGAIIDASATVDSGPQADAFDCSPAMRLSIDILNPGGASGDVLVSLGGALTTTCRSDDETCYVCISPGVDVSLDPIAEPPSEFTTWNQCSTLCGGGASADPCDFQMPGSNVGCLANFALN